MSSFGGTSLAVLISIPKMTKYARESNILLA